MGKYEGEAKVDDFKFTNENRYELLFLERIIESTVFGGEIAVIVPDGMLEATSREGFRMKLLDHCDVNAIISLTRFAFAPYTKEKTYVLFLRRKQKDDVGERQKHPIWHYIVDFDGFANSDKRFRTKYHDDLPEMEEMFDGAMKHAMYYITDHNYYQGKRSLYERIANGAEKEQGFDGSKCGYVNMNAVNKDNFHNLLSEFYLRPVVANPISEIELRGKMSAILASMSSISVPTDVKVGEDDIQNKTIRQLFDYYPGNHGLTEEVIYEQQPTSPTESIPIFSGSQDNETPIGYIKTGAVNNGDKALWYYEGPCLILTKDGSAGLLTYRDKGVFTINHHACVLKTKDEWKDKLHLQWFAYQFQNRLFQVVTSKSDNKVFSTEWFDRLDFEIPKYDEQVRQWKQMKSVAELKDNIRGASSVLSELLSRPLAN